MSINPQTLGGQFCAWLVLGAVAFGSGALTVEMYGQARLRYQVAHGSAGTPGTVTIAHWSGGKTSGCYGRFRPDTGAPRSSTIIRVNGLERGNCTRNTVVPARLLKGDGGGRLNTDDQDEAFTANSGGWMTRALIAAVFAILTLAVGIPWALLTALAPLAALTKLTTNTKNT